MGVQWISKYNAEAPPFERVPLLISKILNSRGFSDQAVVDKFLNPKLSEMRDPLTIDGMQASVDRLIQAFQNQETVCVYADFDLDGTSGLALLTTGLKRLGFQNVVSYQPKRLSQGYGIHKEAIDELKIKNVTLMITVDVGITANEAIAYANENQIQVILTDHHLPHGDLPPALVIVNPNVNRPHPLGHLSGAGVAFYLLWALSRQMKQNQILSSENFDLKEVLDCFVIGTLTDMVPLVDENRSLVKHGLLQLAQTKRPGLKILLKELGLSDRPLTSQDVAIRFAPKLNALSRMEKGLLPIDIFIVETEGEAQNLVKSVMTNNNDRVNLQADAEKKALELLKDWPHKDFVFVKSTEFHKGVVGLIATKLSQIYDAPAFVGSENELGVITGSARRPGSCDRNLVLALESATDFLSRFGGHAQAAGFELESSDFANAIEKLTGFYQAHPRGQVEAKVYFDVEAKLSELNESFMKWYEFLGPFGESFQNPLFLFKDIIVKSWKELRGGHMRYRLQDIETGDEFDALLFSPDPKTVLKPKGPFAVEILGEPQWNYFMGNKSIQILIREMRETQNG